MNYEEWKANMEKMTGEVPKPLDLLARMDLERVLNHAAEKKAAYAGEALPQKFKSLLAVAVGIALDSPSCIKTNVIAAKAAGASTKEIVEAFAVAKFSKGSSALSASLAAFEWLDQNGDK